jgi:hypothetical protein
MNLPEGIHPLVWLGARLALAFAALPLCRLAALLTLGRERREAFASEQPRAHAFALAIGVGIMAALLGWDAADPDFVGARLATHPVVRALSAVVFAAMATFPLFASLRAGDTSGEARDVRAAARIVPADRDGRLAMVALALTAFLPFGLLAGARASTSMADDLLSPAALARAQVRRALVPTDGNARTALAYRAAFSDLDRARRELAQAIALGAPASRTLEVESEIRARMGDCRGAELAFRSALEARVPTDPAQFARASLSLRDFHLPPSLVTRCHYGVR